MAAVPAVLEDMMAETAEMAAAETEVATAAAREEAKTVASHRP